MKKKELRTGILVMLALFFMLFIYAPIELYSYNQEEFWFDLYDLLPLALGLFTIALLAAGAVLCVIYKVSGKLYHVILTASCIVFVCTYIQGNFLIGHLPPMDGTELVWSDYTADRIYTLILWVVVTGLVLAVIKFVSYANFIKAVRLVAPCVTLMLTLTLGTIILSTKSYEKKLNVNITANQMFEMSTDKNFVIFVLDSVDSEMLYNELEKYPQYKEVFEDFTYYPNTLGAYPFTKHAVPFILSGKWCESGDSFGKYRVEVYGESPFFASLEERGYTLGMYEDSIPLWDECVLRFRNVTNQSGISSYFEFAKMEIRLVGLRYAPFELKKYCVFDTKWFGALMKLNPDCDYFSADNLVFNDLMLNRDVTYTNTLAFKFIHIDGSHVPFIMDEDLNIIDDGTYEDALKCSMTLAERYLNKLKEAGVYDNSVIIVMSDHGWSAVGQDGRDRQNPMLFVKGIGEKHEMQVSQAPVSFADLQEAYERLLDGKSSSEIFDWKEGELRERRYLYYPEFEQDDVLEEYIHTGHAFYDTMAPTGN